MFLYVFNVAVPEFCLLLSAISSGHKLNLLIFFS